MIEIRCTRENLREELSDLFPDPFEDETQLIEDCVSHANAGVMAMEINAETGERVKVTIVTQAEIDADLKAEWDALPFPEKVERMRKTGVGADPEKTLSDLQKVLAITPEEDDAWRVLESQKATEGLEQHAARRHAARPGVYDMSQPANEVFNRVTLTPLTKAGFLAAAGIVVTAKDLGDCEHVDNANTAEVDTFTDGPEERYSAQPIGFYGAFVVEDRQNPTDWIAKCVKQEFAQLIVDALNAWEASQ